MRTLLLRFTRGTSPRARASRATTWMLAGTATQQIFAMLGAIAAARFLGPAAFGELGIVRSTTLVFTTLAGSSGLSMAVTRYVAALRNDDPLRAGRVIGLILNVGLALSMTASLVYSLLAIPIATQAVHVPRMALPLAVSAPAIIFTIVGGVQLGVIAGCESFRVAATLIAVEGIVSALLMAAGAWLGGVTGAAAGLVVGTGLTCLFKHRLMLRECKRASIAVAYRGVRPELSVLGEFVIPAILLGVAAQPAEWLSRVLLAREGLVQVGLFSAAFTWAQIVQFIPTQIASPAMPMLTTLQVSGDVPAFRRLLRDMLLMSGATAMCIAVPLAALAKPVMRMYGSEFTSAWTILMILCLSSVVASISAVLRVALLASGRAWMQSVHAVIWGIVLLATYWMTRPWGAHGLAIAYLAAFAILTFTQGHAVWSVTRVRKIEESP